MANITTAGYGPTREARRHNIGRVDRWMSGLLGFLALTRMGSRHGFLGRMMAVTSGAMLLTRAATGHSKVYDALGVNSAGLAEGASIDIESSVTVKRPRQELYDFWRNVENLPLVIRHIESVERTPDGITHWRIKGPRDISVDWDAAIMNEERGEYIAWHSTPDSRIEHAGSVHFRDAGDAGTEVQVQLRYRPPGMAGFGVAKLLNSLTEAEVTEDLQQFKRMMESGAGITAGTRRQ